MTESAQPGQRCLSNTEGADQFETTDDGFHPLRIVER
jgi:hypothetical protein